MVAVVEVGVVAAVEEVEEAKGEVGEADRTRDSMSGRVRKTKRRSEALD